MIRAPSKMKVGAARRGDERGGAIVLVLLIAFAALWLGIAGSQTARIEIQIARNDLFEKKALAVAEGGLNHAFTLISGSAESFDDELAGDGTEGALLDDSLTDGSFDWNRDGTAESYRFRSYPGGSSDGYYVRVQDNFDEEAATDDPIVDADGIVKVVSIGVIGPGPARRMVEGLVGFRSGPDCAISSQGDIDVSGNPTIVGERGCIHTNSDVVAMSGQAILESGATSTGEMTIQGNPTMEDPWGYISGSEQVPYANAHKGQAEKPIPPICPLEFGGNDLNLAAEVHALGGYLLSEDGKIYNSSAAWNCLPSNTGENPCTISLGTCGGSSACVHNGSNGPWNGWKWSGPDSSATPQGKWVYENVDAFDGAFFVEGWVEVSADAGSVNGRWLATIVAMNTISVSGNPVIVPYATTGNLRNVLFVSGNDLGLSGNLGDSDRPAAAFTHQQIKINGNSNFAGFFMVEDGATTCSPNTAPTKSSKESKEDVRNVVSGNISMTFTGNVDTALFPGSLSLLSWNEVRDP